MSRYLDELDDLLAVDGGLSDWELEFVESVHDQVQDGRELTDRQIEKIGEIWDKHCG